ncbi:dienelactone hydrolase family protein [Rhodocaloribacter litoris]|uniref:dienelactone hydrolase family protein n=1 Tax=Rhodocaloribacter litoris TaxID=2558931 RepID=UPI00141DF0C7|nr:dienelactone hydrolase family protein [Rhodocaloribacter litoris]QXD15817.1 dienelactone hydrolase family protein [Rhodocaloribacter litoris]
MKRSISKEDLSQEVFDLYDLYAHDQIDRRTFVSRLSQYAAGGVTVAALLDYLMPKYATARQVQPGDPRLDEEYVTYASPRGGGTIRGLLAWPAGAAGPWPGVVVVHENRGLNPHIEDVCRRAALAGFVALAPDALTPLGGYPGNDDEGRALQRQRDRDEMLEDFIAGFDYLKRHPRCTGRAGVVGFCFGGWVANMMAVRVPELGAAVPFYGGQPAAEDVPTIQAPLMLHFAGLDARVNAGWPAYEAALMEHQKAYSTHFYPHVNHGFHNDTTPRYDEAAARKAWQRTVDFLRENLA